MNLFLGSQDENEYFSSLLFFKNHILLNYLLELINYLPPQKTRVKISNKKNYMCAE